MCGLRRVETSDSAHGVPLLPEQHCGSAAPARRLTAEENTFKARLAAIAEIDGLMTSHGLTKIDIRWRIFLLLE